MSRQKKKRNKQYTGDDAARGPVVHHYKAEVKSPAREWWDGHKRAFKWGAGLAGGAAIVGWLLFELFSMVF